MERTLEIVAREAADCPRCRLAGSRTQVVFGVGHPTADLMFIGEAPGFHEDKQGEPFVGAAGQLLNQLLSEIEIPRSDVYINNVILCRPPGNRDPLPDEIEACRPYLEGQLGFIDPAVVVTLGNFATKLLSGKPTGITRVHGVPQQVTLGGNAVTLYPLYHPAAALYTRSMLSVLEQDFARIPELLGRAAAAPAPTAAAVPEPVAEPERSLQPAVQLGLF